LKYLDTYLSKLEWTELIRYCLIISSIKIYVHKNDVPVTGQVWKESLKNSFGNEKVSTRYYCRKL